MQNLNDSRFQLKPAEKAQAPALLNSITFTEKALRFGVDEWTVNEIIDCVRHFDEKMRPKAYEAALKLCATPMSATEIKAQLEKDWNAF